MKISLSWLKDYIQVDLPVDRISEILTLIGLEVEGTEERETIKGGLENFVIGHVVSCEQHPNADKLSITRVDTGESELKHIVCGAPNVAQGQKVVVAQVGAKIYTEGDEFFKIKKSKIRGEVSEGMICAEDELGMGSAHDGIMVLDPKAKVGQSAAEFFNIKSDIIFDIGLTPNRSDATSHMGVARDLLAFLKVNENSEASLKIPKVNIETSEGVSDFNIAVEDTKACPRYSGICLEDVIVGHSPDWIKQRLELIGVRSINNIVDITNFVLHEMGQPLHAFDMDQLGGNGIIVKFLPEGSSFKTLDDVDRKLRQDDLMICDAQSNPKCMAGVFGGIASGVTLKTTRIFLESAHFNAKTIRRTSMSHFLRTDAAMVYEKGSDPDVTIPALKRAVQLFQEYANAKVVSQIYDIYPKPVQRPEVVVRWKEINRVVGNNISNATVESILLNLDFEILDKNSSTLKVLVPLSRADVLREIDVIEEILRIYGFENVILNPYANYRQIAFDYPSKRHVQNIASNLLSSRGFHEIMGMTLTKNSSKEKDSSQVFITNTSNVELNLMRPDMLRSGLESLAHNINRRQNFIRFYEFGKTYKQLQDSSYEEDEFLTIFASGMPDKNWRDGDRPTDYYDLKGAVHLILSRFSILKHQTSELEDDRFSYGLKYHRGKQQLVNFGCTAGSILKNSGVAQDVFYAEFNWPAIVKAAQSSSVSVTMPGKYPGTVRDVAMTIPITTKFSSILVIANKTGGKILQKVELFDVYQSKEMKAGGQKSYAIGLHFESPERTLQDKEINKIMQRLFTSLEQKIGAQIRK